MEITIDDKPRAVDIVMTENGCCSYLHDGNSYNAELARDEDGHANAPTCCPTKTRSAK